MRKKPQLISILLVVAMFAIAGYAAKKEIIFPEIAALTLGAWVMERSPWRCAVYNFWLSPTLAAVTGVFILRVFPYSPLLLISVASAVVALQLKILHSDVFPSFSAAILPVVIRVDSWLYPLSVCLLTGIVALGRYFQTRHRSEKTSGEINASIDLAVSDISGSSNELKYWGKLLLGILMVSTMALESGWLFMIAPPLIVAFAEISKPETSLRNQSLKIMLLLVFAAFIGVFWLEIFHHFLRWPIWIFACMSVASVFLLCHFIQFSFPPASAIALLPALVPAKTLLLYPLHVAFGSAVFISLSWFLFRQQTVSLRRFPTR